MVYRIYPTVDRAEVDLEMEWVPIWLVMTVLRGRGPR